MKEGSGTAAGVALGVFVFLLVLPFVLVITLYTSFTIYAMTKGTAFGAGTINLPLFFTGLAVVTAALVVLVMGSVALAARSLNPPKRRRGRS